MPHSPLLTSNTLLNSCTPNVSSQDKQSNRNKRIGDRTYTLTPSLKMPHERNVPAMGMQDPEKMVRERGFLEVTTWSDAP